MQAQWSDIQEDMSLEDISLMFGRRRREYGVGPSTTTATIHNADAQSFANNNITTHNNVSTNVTSFKTAEDALSSKHSLPITISQNLCDADKALLRPMPRHKTPGRSVIKKTSNCKLEYHPMPPPPPPPPSLLILPPRPQPQSLSMQRQAQMPGHNRQRRIDNGDGEVAQAPALLTAAKVTQSRAAGTSSSKTNTTNTTTIGTTTTTTTTTIKRCHIEKSGLYIDNPDTILFTVSVIMISDGFAKIMLYNDLGHYLISGPIDDCTNTLRTIPGSFLFLTDRHTLLRFVDHSTAAKPIVINATKNSLFECVESFGKQRIGLIFRVAQKKIDQSLLAQTLANLYRHNKKRAISYNVKVKSYPYNLYTDAVQLFIYLKLNKLLGQLKVGPVLAV